MNEIVTPIASKKNVVSTFVTTFAAAAIALPIALAIMPNATNTQHAIADGQTAATTAATDAGLGSCTTALDATPSTSALSVAPADVQRRVVVETVTTSTGNGNNNTNGNGSQANGNTQTNTGGLIGGVNAIVPVSILNGNEILSGNTVELENVLSPVTNTTTEVLNDSPIDLGAVTSLTGGLL